MELENKEAKTMEKHIAYNLTTGEVVACSTSNQLKRYVRNINRANHKWGYSSGKWVFSHRGVDALMAKVNRVRCQRLGK